MFSLKDILLIQILDSLDNCNNMKRNYWAQIHYDNLKYVQERDNILHKTTFVKVNMQKEFILQKILIKHIKIINHIDNIKVVLIL
jgi:hypothetical protein